MKCIELDSDEVFERLVFFISDHENTLKKHAFEVISGIYEHDPYRYFRMSHAFQIDDIGRVLYEYRGFIEEEKQKELHHGSLGIWDL